jgi:hypothetical protein
MNQRLIGKGLTVAVILLFVGVGVQPAIAKVESRTTKNDDCNLCPKKVNNLRIDETISLKDLLRINDDLKNKSFFNKDTYEDSKICDILLLVFFRYVTAIIGLNLIINVFYSNLFFRILFFPVYLILTTKNTLMGVFLLVLAERINCDWFSPFFTEKIK